MFWFFLVLALILFIYYVFVLSFKYWTDRGIPQYSVWRIWMNSVIEMFVQPPLTDVMLKLCNDFADHRYVGDYQFLRPRLCVKDPDLIKTIFVKDFDYFQDHTRFLPDDGDPILSKSLFVLTGDNWRNMRTLATPSFSSSKMKIMFRLMVECAERFMHFFEEQNSDLTMEMKETFARITNDVFASTHFGVVCDSLKNPHNDMYQMGEKAFAYGSIWFKLKFVVVILIPQITKALGVRIMNQEVINFFKELVRNNIRHRQNNGIFRPDLIHILMEESNRRESSNGVDHVVEGVRQRSCTSKQGKRQNFPLTDDDRTALAATFFGGGFDSISTLLCFAAYELTLHLDIQEKLQSEVDDVLDTCQGVITYEALIGMKYMDMVLSETLRKWPGGFFLDRCCVKPYTIEPVQSGEVPVRLNKGDSIWIPLFALQRDPKFFPEPDRFIPERFDEVNKSELNPYAFLPFGVGPRQCVGSRFALLEAKLVIFHILSKYNFVAVDKTPVPVRLERRYFQLISKDGFWLGLKRRSTVNNY